MNPSEISFWERHARLGTLMEAIRIHGDRARTFFGITALSQSEGDLYRTLEAHKILNTSDQDLMAQAHSRSQSVKSLKIVPEDLRGLIDETFELTGEDTKWLKKHAQDHLKGMGVRY